VGLVNRQCDQLTGGGMLLQNGTGGFPLKTLRREVQQPQGTIAELRKRLPSLHGLDPSVQTGRCNPTTAQLKNLIFHQGYQWRNHNHEP
jgi:hypothetical protein